MALLCRVWGDDARLNPDRRLLILCCSRGSHTFLNARWIRKVSISHSHTKKSRRQLVFFLRSFGLYNDPQFGEKSTDESRGWYLIKILYTTHSTDMWCVADIIYSRVSAFLFDSRNQINLSVLFPCVELLQHVEDWLLFHLGEPSDSISTFISPDKSEKGTRMTFFMTFASPSPSTLNRIWHYPVCWAWISWWPRLQNSRGLLASWYHAPGWGPKRRGERND